MSVATRSSTKKLRSFSVLVGDEGNSASEPGDKIVVESDRFPRLAHASLVGRGTTEMGVRDIQRAPELLMFKLPGRLLNGYPNIERFAEDSGREVLGIVGTGESLGQRSSR